MAVCADHGLRAGEDFAAAGSEGDPGEAEGDDAEAEACADGGCGVDAQFGDGAVDERGEAEDEGDDAGEREDSVAAELCFEQHQDEGGEQQHDGGVPDGKEIEAEEAEEDEERAEGAGDDGAGDVELEVDEEAAEDEQENGDVGVGEFAEEALAQWRAAMVTIAASLEVQGLGGAVEAVDLAAVEGV